MGAQVRRESSAGFCEVLLPPASFQGQRAAKAPSQTSEVDAGANQGPPCAPHASLGHSVSGRHPALRSSEGTLSCSE